MHLCNLNDLSSRRGTRFDLPDGTEIALFVVEGEVYAVSTVCPHLHIPMMHEGAIEEGTVTCPMHARRYRLIDGVCLEPHGSALIETYRVEVRGQQVHVEIPDRGEPKWARSLSK